MPLPDPCVVIVPCLNEARTIGPLVQSLLALTPHILVLDDGSTDHTAPIAREAGADVHSHPTPRGKGASLRHASLLARQQGHSLAILIDGDGQHLPEDIPHLLQRRRATNASLVVGNRLANPRSMPPVRRWTNQLMSRVLSSHSGQHWPDTQCGFRVVDLPAFAAAGLRSERFEIESEMLLRFWHIQAAIAFQPIQTIYNGGHSHIHPLKDTLRWLSWLLKIRAELGRVPRQIPFPQTAHGSI